MQKNSQMFMFGDAYGKALDDMNKGIMELDNETLTNLAILRDNIRDQQGDVLTFDIPQEEEDDLMDYDEFYDMPEEQSRGILDILKTAGGNVLDFIGSGGFIGRGITGLANMLGDTFKGSRFYNPVSPMSGKRIFAPGARAGDAFGLNFRRDANRFGNMLNRLAAGKKIGRSNLQDIMDRRGLTGIDVQGMADSIRESSDTGYGGFGSASAAAEAAASGGRDYSSSPGAMAGDMEYGEE
tara:strand:+ start:1773 stop:2489 length:717 start_codon:yes stop_codon:yes gene_type:complete